MGDAAGRQYAGLKSDFSSTDRKWALNIGIPFFTPEVNDFSVIICLRRFLYHLICRNISFNFHPIPRSHYQGLMFLTFPSVRLTATSLTSTNFRCTSPSINTNIDTIAADSWKTGAYNVCWIPLPRENLFFSSLF